MLTVGAQTGTQPCLPAGPAFFNFSSRTEEEEDGTYHPSRFWRADYYCTSWLVKSGFINGGALSARDIEI